MSTSLNKLPVWSKLPNTETTIFTVMSKLALDHQAINLSQGFPDFDAPHELIELVAKYLATGYNQYAPMGGALPLRKSLANKIESQYEVSINPNSEITITAGATQAIYTIITAFLKENDEVIVFDPAYDSYLPAIQLNGAKPICIQLKAPDYKIPWESVKKLMNTRTRMIILNSPHNPTGAVLDANDIDQLRRIIGGTDIYILSDEVYEHIIFDGQMHQSMLRYPDLLRRSIITYSFGKTFHTTGWKVGYCIAPDYLMKEIRKVHQYMVFSVNTPMQHAIADYLQDKTHYEKLSSFYQQKRDYFLSLIKDSRFKFTPSAGSYFQLLDYSAITNKKDTDFAIELTKKHKVASIPISVFYNNKLDQKMLRFCFAKKAETLALAAEQLCKV